MTSRSAPGPSIPRPRSRSLGPEPWNAAYVQPSRRPRDGRYGANPNRLQHYYQFQVLLKPAPDDVQERYLGSIEALGIDARGHDIRFVEDDWESPTLGAWGLGWEVWCDGMEVTQFTYFQQIGGLDCDPVSVELTYGLERLAMYVQGVVDVFALDWNGGGVTYAMFSSRPSASFRPSTSSTPMSGDCSVTSTTRKPNARRFSRPTPACLCRPMISA